MRFEVPQFIEVEDKIIGPLTWRQFIYVAGGIGVAIISYVLLPPFLFVLIGIPIATLAGFLAFHEVNNRPFSYFLEAFFQYITNKKLYLWKRSNKQVVTGSAPKKNVQETDPTAAVASPTPQKKISDLSRQLALDTLEAQTDENIAEDIAKNR